MESVEPNLLVGRVLKGRYFPFQNVLTVSQKPNDSWLWRSWLGTKEQVQEGPRWRIADGRSTQIWDDKWLNGNLGAKVLSKRPEECYFQWVYQLIDKPANCWNRPLVENLFIHEEAQQI